MKTRMGFAADLAGYAVALRGFRLTCEVRGATVTAEEQRMQRTVLDLVHGGGGNYILPFFWQHGETEAVLREYMGAIQACGIGAVCVEARPHPDFVGPRWWADMDIILDEARKRGMKVWILDDAHFPTGQAAGALRTADPELCKQYLMTECADVCGPLPEATLHVADIARTVPSPFDAPTFPPNPAPPRVFADDALLAVVASRLVEGNRVDDALLDLTAQVIDGQLRWDVPEGMWRIFVLYTTRNGGGRTDYINMLDESSCRVQIDAVYEPHYAHYREDFGTTIAGFFSDEPALGNTQGFNFDESIGRKRMPLPWNKDMPGLLKTRLGDDYLRSLPALWTDVGDASLTARVRYAYMDSATTLMARNFSGQIGAWCDAHGVEYIGHIIEDNNQHSRLGCSQGHFFRAMQGQHMAGIDNIGNQVLPGGENHNRLSRFTPPGDGEFYHFALGKLGSSHAHIDPHKQGRAMCEIYGAYGWNTGVRQMKSMTDHFLVRGINRFVPHAFSPKAFPDPDCPPHFYAHGYNPLYRHFGKLMRYLNRMCHVFSDGRHVAPVAMLYHGEAEWTGAHMFLQKPARQLLEHQIDFDVVPADVFADRARYRTTFDGALHVNVETYNAFVVPYAEFVTRAVAEFAAQAADAGFPVLFVDALPRGVCDCAPDESAALIAALGPCRVVHLPDLAETLRGLGVVDVRVEPAFTRLRYYRYVKDGVDAFMVSNEDPAFTFTGTIELPIHAPMTAYDAMENRLCAVDAVATETGTRVRLDLRPHQSIVLIADAFEDEPRVPQRVDGVRHTLDGEWTLSIATAKEYPAFHDAQTITALRDVGRIWPDFSGFMRYETRMVLPDPAPANVTLILEDAFEGVEVWVDDTYAGMMICPPYIMDLSSLFDKPGEHTLRIEVANTLYRQVKAQSTEPDFFGPRGVVVEPSGIVGRVYLDY